MKSTTFENLEIPQKETSHISHNRYRVYSDSEQFTVIEAPSAKAAMAASGIAKPYRVQREELNFNNIVKIKDAPPKTAAEEPHVPEYVTAPVEHEASEAVAAEPVAEPQAAPIEEKPLSTEDVNTLLKGE